MRSRFLTRGIYIIFLLIGLTLGSILPRPEGSCSVARSEIVSSPVLLTQASIGGVNYWFILDTGSSFNVLDLTVALRHHLPIDPLPSGVKVFSHGGSADIYSVIGRDSVVSISGTYLNEPWYIQNLTDVFNPISKRAGFPVVGIIGCKQLTELEGGIDLRTNVLSINSIDSKD